METSPTTNKKINKTPKLKLNFKESKYATGRRKTSIAKVWLKKGSGKIYVNGKDFQNYFSSESHKMQIMRPFEKLQNFSLTKHSNTNSLDFWRDSYLSIQNKDKNTFEIKDLDVLNSSFQDYQIRVFNNNSKLFIKLIRLFSPIPAFKKITIYLSDLNENVMVDLFSHQITVTKKDPEISMTSESLDFIFKNTFGFDTLTVNGCFEELKKGSFTKMVRTLAIENLNNIGISLNFLIFFRIDLVYLFLKRLFIVAKKIET